MIKTKMPTMTAKNTTVYFKIVVIIVVFKYLAEYYDVACILKSY